MNANELADKILDRDCYREYIIDAVVILRKQQAEIEHLKELFEKAMRMIEK